MSTTPPSLSDFRPVVGGETPEKKKFRFSRSVVIGVVVGAHVIVGAMFAMPRVIKAIEEVRWERASPPVQLVDMDITAAETEVTARSRKARSMKPAKGESPAQLAQRAGIRIDAPVRTMLLVVISQEGKAGNVSVAESSGNARLDDIAAQYVRAQEWAPVKEAGDVEGSVPFIVEFTADSGGIS
jgi:TonB family protein